MNRIVLSIRTWLLTTLFLLMWIFWFRFPGSHAEIVDRILAVVNDEIIALSDVKKYQALFGDGRGTEAILEELIDLQLLLAEARKFEMPQPTAEGVEEAHRKLIERLENKATLIDLLGHLSLSEEKLREMLRARLMVSQLLEERVTFFVFVFPRDVEAYYKTHEDEFSGKTLEQVRSIIQDRLTQQKADLRRKEYLNRLRNRTAIRLN